MMMSPFDSIVVSWAIVFSVILPCGSMIQIARGLSVSLATTSASSEAPVAPSGPRPCTAGGVGAHPPVEWPARMRGRDIFAPILPNPMMPSCMGFLRCRLGGRSGLCEGAHCHGEGVGPTADRRQAGRMRGHPAADAFGASGGWNLVHPLQFYAGRYGQSLSGSPDHELVGGNSYFVAAVRWRRRVLLRRPICRRRDPPRAADRADRHFSAIAKFGIAV